ncbi:MAG: heparinase II/III family protein [Balneolaceae bacterium]|nr:heparinase II/III family protein [Balneolaceae bacterium]
MNFKKLFYSIRYTTFSQLVNRLKLMIKRKVMEAFPGYFNRKFKRRALFPERSDELPKPIFTNRKGAFKRGDEKPGTFSLAFLNESRTCSLPLNWHPGELEHGTRLWKLNLHYMEFLEQVNNEWFTKIVADWIEQNPPYKKGYWLDSWNSFALSIRVVVWMQQIARRKEYLGESFLGEVSESIYGQLLFLENNLEKDIKGNHLIKNIKALLWGASFFKQDTNVKRWHAVGKKLLQQELDEQVLSDGMHYERSPAYHCQVLADLIECYLMLDDQKIKNSLEVKLANMGNALMKVTHPDGNISLFNDGGLQMAYAPDELLEALGKTIDFTPDERNELILKEAGYYGLQKNGSYLLFDAGKIAPDFYRPTAMAISFLLNGR